MLQEPKLRILESSRSQLDLTKSMSIPERVRNPSAAREALGLSPLVKARWADASRVESVPLVSAGAEPFIFLAGRPTAKRAADARTRWLPVAFESAIQHGGIV